MEINICETIRPMLTNKAYKNVPGKGRIKSGDYRRFKTDLLIRLKSYEEERKQFLDLIKDQRFIIESTLTTFVPEKFMYTKENDISIRKGDCHSYRKCLQDVVFEWLGIDDKYIIDSHDHQRVDPQGLWGFSFKVEVKGRE